jgi:hypothetical protein
LTTNNLIRKYLTTDFQDAFFSIQSLRNKKAFFKDCISKAYRVWTDELDCNKSLSRTRTDKTPKEVIDIAEKSGFSHYVFILRNSMGREDPYIEAGIRTDGGNGKDYFLWINIKPEKLEYFLNKYKLKNM